MSSVVSLGFSLHLGGFFGSLGALFQLINLFSYNLNLGLKTVSTFNIPDHDRPNKWLSLG